jgi:hypothetical protein
LNRQAAIVQCARLNALIFNTSNLEYTWAQKKVLDALVRDGWVDERDSHKLQKYLSKMEAKKKYPVFLTRPGLIEMIRWLSVYGDGNQSDKPLTLVHKHSFIKAILYCNELYGARVISPVLSPNEISAGNEKKYLPAMFRLTTWGGKFSDELSTLGRADLLLREQFFDVFPSHKKAFEEIYGFSVADWLLFHIALLAVLPKSKAVAESRTLVTLKNAFEFDPEAVMENAKHLLPSFQRFLTLKSQTVSELVQAFSSNTLSGNQNFSFRALRQKPILSLDNLKFIILDPRLFWEDMLAGPMFAVAKSTKAEQAFADFGTACQNYVFNLLKASNEHRSDEHRCSFMVNEPEGSPMPINDILIGQDETFAFIEAKGVWLNDDLLYESDPELLWEAVIKKYAQHAPGSVRSKGVGQLAAVIQGLISNSLKPGLNAEMVSKAKEIIPILVVQDAVIADKVFSTHLVKSFATFMGNDEVPIAGHFLMADKVIHNLIVLGFDDVEILAQANSGSSLLEIFRNYSQMVPLRKDHLSDFLTHPSQSMKWHRSVVSERASALLDQISRRSFGIAFPPKVRD